MKGTTRTYCTVILKEVILHQKPHFIRQLFKYKHVKQEVRSGNVGANALTWVLPRCLTPAR